MERNNELAYLLKHGRSEEARLVAESVIKTEYPDDFRSFMDQMIDEHKISRKNVAIRAGLSQDYTYKLLRGDKKTPERDYIIAICMALELTLSETQHALAISGMPILNRVDGRSNIIYLAIQDHMSIDDLNQWLEDVHYPLIKVSPDMPSAPIMFSGNDIEHKKSTHIYEEIECNVDAEQCGMAPMDYAYCGILVVTDETGKKYYVEASYSPDGDNLIVLDEDNYASSLEYLKTYDESIYVDVLEQYDSLISARKSDFFEFFLKLDRETDNKVIEVMKRIDDTRNYPFRIGAGFDGSGKKLFLEIFNNEKPEERQYFQIMETDEGITYSTSHESYYLRMELGELYPAYFGEKEDPEYFVKVTNLNDIDSKYAHFNFIFRDLLLTMHEYAKENFGGSLFNDDETLVDEKITALAQRSTTFYRQGKYQESLKYQLELNELLEDLGKKGAKRIIPLAIAYYKTAIIFDNLGDEKKSLDAWNKLYIMKNDITQLSDEDFETICNVRSSVAEAAYTLATIRETKCGLNDSTVKKYLEECRDILVGYCSFESAWILLYKTYQKLAFAIDNDDPELAVEYTDNAINIVRDNQLDGIPDEMLNISALYNNHAWVLWNKLGSEEAIIYYGRAIELAEICVNKGYAGSMAKTQLQHVSEALLKLYSATGKEKEAERLTKRLKKYEIGL